MSGVVMYSLDPIGLMGNKGARKHLLKVKFPLFPHNKRGPRGWVKLNFYRIAIEFEFIKETLK